MKAVPLAFRGVLLSLLTTSLHAQGPVLSTPGTATWSTEATATGTRTVFTITGNTVLDWNRMNLAPGNELVFDFLGGESVVNNLLGTKAHRIDGSVTSNGIVGFFSPNAHLQVNGSITAKGVTIATLDVNPVDFASGSYVMSGGAGRVLTVDGKVGATGGDVVLAGSSLTLGGSTSISASGHALLGGGETVSIAPSGIRRINVVGTIGEIYNRGSVTASRMEVAAGNQIVNDGRLDVGAADIFLEVGKDGTISNETNGVIVGAAAFKGALVDKGLIIEPHEGDIPPLVSESRLKVPTLKSPNGKVVSTSKKLSYSAPMSASSDAGRTSKRQDRDVAKVESSRSLLQRSSFFGVRGGKTISTRSSQRN